MARTTNNKLVRFLVLVMVVIVAIYGLGLFLTSSFSTVGGLNYHAGKIQANSNRAVSTSTTASSNAVFTARRIAILLMNDHPMLNQASAKLREDLVGLDYVDEVDVFRPDEAPEFGGRLYDSYLKLSIGVQKDSKPFIEREFVATIHFSAGTLPYKSYSSYNDHLAPPELGYLLSGKLDHTSQSTQIGTPYKLIADNVAGELSGSITEQFAQWDSEYGIDHEWPQALIGQYPEDLTIPWPDGVKLDRVIDGYGLMRYRHAMWTTQTDQPKTLMQVFHHAYTDAGWQTDSGAALEEDEHTHRYHFRAWNGAPHQIEVYEIRDGYGERKPGEVSRVCVRYEHRFDGVQALEIIDSLLESDDNLETLGCLTRQMSPEQADRYYQSLAEKNPTDLKSLLDLARYSHRKDRSEEARRYLMRAYLNAHRSPDLSKVRDKIEKAAKEMGIEDVADPPLTTESLAEFGYQSTAELVGSQSSIGFNEPILFYYTSEGKTHAVDLWLAPDPNTPGGVIKHDYERHGDGSTSWGSGGGFLDDGEGYVVEHINSDEGMFTIQIRQSEDNDEFFDVEVVAAP